MRSTVIFQGWQTRRESFVHHGEPAEVVPRPGGEEDAAVHLPQVNLFSFFQRPMIVVYASLTYIESRFTSSCWVMFFSLNFFLMSGWLSHSLEIHKGHSCSRPVSITFFYLLFFLMSGWRPPFPTTTSDWSASKQDSTHSQSSSTPISWQKMFRVFFIQVNLSGMTSF